MLYNICIEYKDGTVEKFQRRSNIKPANSFKLHDKIAIEIHPKEWKEIITLALY